MLKFRWHSVVDRTDRPAELDTRDDGSLLDRVDLRIGNLLDDPRLRQAMGLDLTDEAAPAAARPAPRFDRRRLLDDVAA